MYIYIHINIPCLGHSGEYLMRTSFMFVRSLQAIWRSSAPCLSTLVTKVVLCSLTRAALMSLGKDKTCV